MNFKETKCVIKLENTENIYFFNRAKIFFTVYLIIGTCLLVNMLIAMMDHTQEITNDRPNEWIRQVIISS